MSRDAVSVRIRGRGETILEVQFKDVETVAEFKARVFGDKIGEGQKCRLIASGKELQDSNQMGVYRLQENAFLHVMICDGGLAARTAALSSSAAAPAASPAASPASSVPAGGSRPRAVGEGAGLAILCTLTLGMVVAAWTARMAFPNFFSSAATGFLLLLTSLQLAATLPLLKNAVTTALGACSCWWRPPPGGRTSSAPSSSSSSSSSRAVPGRRRQ